MYTYRSKKKSDKSRSRKHTEPSDQDAPAKKVKVVTSPDSKGQSTESHSNLKTNQSCETDLEMFFRFAYVVIICELEKLSRARFKNKVYLNFNRIKEV